MTIEFTSEQLASFQSLEKQRKQIQNTMDIPLIKQDYIVSGRVYYNSIGGLLHAFDADNAVSADFIEGITRQDATTRTSVNLTFQSPGINLSKLKQKIDVIPLLEEFFQETGTMCTCIQNKRVDRPEQDDQILVCHGVNHTDNDPDIGTQNPKIHTAFYGFLLAKQILKLSDFEDSTQFSDEFLQEIKQAGYQFLVKSQAPA